ncbi:MAG: methylated-DNA--[protein]-cysteine S-methyltransferase [Acinetobacter harbinensis]|uniref:methylated-DNA--[protein]-cysteine S-methyltransferase n=1 Tax=Acinetobacter sp. TaxID=472 RepID=UPI0025799F9E|nr:methylated-DNA--[protein]-cysteine S-methyltransferase [Acinetobacter sp.]MBR5557955.1 methylated-DNA--[protein]-cysteine S-methyltransferase [Acinetobacter sp.]MDD2939991.1 methylated-DNA--[protein]-cysteine S-methyltransferase [Acinetobacter harbinensis]
MQLHFIDMPSPVGRLKLVANSQALVAVVWENEQPKCLDSKQLLPCADHPILLATQKQLSEYFAGQRQHFDLPLTFEGTDFQQKVWQALLSIPFAETRSYRDIAAQIGNVKAVRAVGAANGKNPISIIAPCHRVIGANGQLVGFAGGLNNKHILLQLEQQVAQTSNS